MEAEEPQTISSNTIKLTATTEFETVSFMEQRDVYTMANIEAPLYEAKVRAKLHLIAVIDRSGSMSGDKLKLVKETLKFIVSQLKSRDSFSLISFESDVRIEFPLIQMNGQGKVTANTKIEALETAGSTNLSGGLLEGISQARTVTNASEEVTSIILMTDGQANVGVTNADDLVRLTQQSITSLTVPVSINTFGYGGDHSQDLLRKISEISKNIYYFIESPDHIPRAFGDCIGGLLSVVGQNMRLNIEGLGGVILEKPLVKYPITELTNEMGEKTFSIQLGDIYSEEIKNIVSKVTVPQLQQARPEQSIIRYTLSYINVITGKSEVYSLDVKLSRPETSGPSQPNLELDKQKNRILTTQALSEADKFGKEDKFDEARQTLQKASELLTASPSSADPYVQSLIKELSEAQRRMRSHDEYETSGSKYINTRISSHTFQRSSHYSPMYSNSSKRTYTSYDNDD